MNSFFKPNHPRLDSFLKASKLHAKILNKEWGAHEPNTETKWHNEDDENAFEFGGTGKQIRTSHLTQDYDWSKHPFTYKWNSLGLRGPEPDCNAPKRMLVIGSSLTIGQGIPLEGTFIDIATKELGYDYINLSEYYILTDSIKSAIEISKEYRPDLVIISSTRHLFSSEFVLRHLFQMISNQMKREEIAPVLWEVFVAEAKKQVFMFEQAIIGACNNNTKILWFSTTEESARKYKLGEMITEESIYEFSTGKHIAFGKDYITDLGRDNKHPGIKSNIKIAELLVNTIKDL